jgi:hypothetical protein
MTRQEQEHDDRDASEGVEQNEGERAGVEIGDLEAEGETKGGGTHYAFVRFEASGSS